MSIIWNICVCTFKRSQKGEWETGIAFLKEAGVSDVLLIVDAKHKPAKPYDYRLTPEYGAMSI